MIGKLVKDNVLNFGIIIKKIGDYYYVRWMDDELIELAYYQHEIEFMLQAYRDWE